MKALSAAQLRSYRAQGFLRLGKVMDARTLATFRKEERRFQGASLPNDFPVPGGGNRFRSLLSAYSEPVRSFLTGGPHLGVVEQLVRSRNVLLWFDQFVTKLPDRATSNGEFPWHQDHGYTQIDPPTDVVLWVALDDCTELNGCLWIQPASHKWGLLPHARKSKSVWYLTRAIDGDGVPVPLKAGEAVAFHGRTFHRSKENLSAKPRRGFFMNYCDAGATSGADRTPVTRFPDRWVVRGQAPLPKRQVGARRKASGDD